MRPPKHEAGKMNHKGHEDHKDTDHKGHEDHKDADHEGHEGHKDANHKGHEDHKDVNHKGHEGHKGYLGFEERKGQINRHDERAIDPIAPEVERVIREAIGAAIDVHRELGPGFIEPVYQRALIIALGHRRLRVDEQMSIDIRYRGELVCRHRLDLVVEGAVVIEVKAVRKLKPLHQAQILSYLKASRCRVGLLMNFNVPMLVDGLRRFVR
jgi:GxxExxY protein